MSLSQEFDYPKKSFLFEKEQSNSSIKHKLICETFNDSSQNTDSLYEDLISKSKADPHKSMMGLFRESMNKTLRFDEQDVIIKRHKMN